MRITTSQGLSPLSGAGGVAATSIIEVQGMSPAGASSGTSPLQSAVFQPALAAMDAAPEIDHALVAELRDAISRGDLPFDASKLAGLIQRFHGGR